MKKIVLIVSALITMAAISVPAQAATAFLVSCRGTSSVTGRFIYVGTYQYGGQYFTETFDSWCPQMVNVY